MQKHDDGPDRGDKTGMDPSQPDETRSDPVNPAGPDTFAEIAESRIPAEAGGGSHLVRPMPPVRTHQAPALDAGDRPAGSVLPGSIYHLVPVDRIPAWRSRLLGVAVVRLPDLEAIEREARMLRNQVHIIRAAAAADELKAKALAGDKRQLLERNAQLARDASEAREQVRRIRDQVARHDEVMGQRLAEAQERATKAEALVAAIEKSASPKPHVN